MRRHVFIAIIIGAITVLISLLLIVQNMQQSASILPSSPTPTPVLRYIPKQPIIDPKKVTQLTATPIPTAVPTNTPAAAMTIPSPTVEIDLHGK